MKMKYIVTAMSLFTGLVLVAWAASPIPSHPAPEITAAKAIELVAEFVGAQTNTARYCSSVALNEGGMVPAPRGSARHWVVTFKDAGGERDVVTHVYVDMKGQASKTTPPMS